MGHQPLRVAASVTMTGWLGRYVAHPDPATAAANLVALVVAGNGPFYPLYVLALIGWGHNGAWLTMLATPFFAAVPAVSRWRSWAGRGALPLVGIANTVWCSALLGIGVGGGIVPAAMHRAGGAAVPGWRALADAVAGWRGDRCVGVRDGVSVRWDDGAGSCGQCGAGAARCDQRGDAERVCRDADGARVDNLSRGSGRGRWRKAPRVRVIGSAHSSGMLWQ